MTLLNAAADRVTAAGYAAGWRALRVMPEPLARRAFQGAADLAVRRDTTGVAQLRRNLERVVALKPPDQNRNTQQPRQLEELVQAGMRSYARYWMETFRLPAMDVDAVLGRTHTDGVPGLDVALAGGRGVILALPHSGNWEVAGLWLVRHGYPFVTVAERLKPESLYDKFVAYRQGLGMRVLPLTGGAVSTTRVLIEQLRGGGVVCLVADRDLSSRGVQVDFFGAPTRMPAGPSQLALATGATLLPVHTYYDPPEVAGSGWGQWIGLPIDFGEREGTDHAAQVRRGTQALAEVFQARIAAHPADWHMLQRLWLADL